MPQSTAPPQSVEWLKRCSLRKQSSTTTVSTDVTDVVSESQLFTLPSGIGSSRTVESTTKRKYSDSYFFLGFTNTGEEIAHDAMCVLCNNVQTESFMLPAKLRRHRDTYHPEYRGTILVFFSSLSLRH